MNNLIRNKVGGGLYLLLTGTIDSSVYNNIESKITDTSVRLSQYEYVIKQYIQSSVFNKIVFAENSGYPFDAAIYEEMAHSVNKNFEYIPCQKHIAETSKYGKAYGEALIIHEALQKSELLKEAEQIYKVTGRIFLLNNSEVVWTSAKQRNVFMLVDKEKWCCSSIFKFNKDDYLKFFDSVICDLLVNYNSMLESSFYKIITDNNLDVDCFHRWPMLEGFQGGSGATYKSSLKGKVYHDILCELRAYRHNSIFQKFIMY